MSITAYTFHEIVGNGNFGDVYRATRNSLGRIVAVKVVNLDDLKEDIGDVIKEIQFLLEMHLPHITQYIETFLLEATMFIVMEYCGGSLCGDLLRCYKKFPEPMVRYIIFNVLKGLEYVHRDGKVHRDVKLANIFLTVDGRIKLGDFGVSGELTLTRCKRNTFVGTPLWMAPEVITRKTSGGYNEKADIWLTGITTIELATGTPPLLHHDPFKILFDIPKRAPPKLSGPNWSADLVDFLKYALQKDPNDRPSALQLLLHTWFQTTKKNSWSMHQAKMKELIAKSLEKRVRCRPPLAPRYLKLDAEGKENRDSESDFLAIPWAFDETKRVHGEVTAKGVETTTKRSLDGDIQESTQESLASLKCHKGYLLFYCLKQVAERGRNTETRETVLKLVRDLRSYETAQPGLCDAIIEELLYIK